jgi:hypothetical protein
MVQPAVIFPSPSGCSFGNEWLRSCASSSERSTPLSFQNSAAPVIDCRQRASKVGRPVEDRSSPLRLQLRFTSQPRGSQPLAIIIEGCCAGNLIGHGHPGLGPFRSFAFFIARFALSCCERRTHFFAFSPSSTRRRMASERGGVSFCFAAHATIAAITSAGNRVDAEGS